MSEVIDNSLRYLTAPDIKAITAYLKSVPDNGDGTDVAAAPTPQRRERLPSSRPRLRRADLACTFSKELASDVTGSMERVQSPITHRS